MTAAGFFSRPARRRDWPRGRIWAIEVRDGRPTYTDLGEGNDPTFSPDDKSIAFLLHASVEAGTGGGLWMMRADGSGRHPSANLDPLSGLRSAANS